jgi:hypothetical protein
MASKNVDQLFEEFSRVSGENLMDRASGPAGAMDAAVGHAASAGGAEGVTGNAASAFNPSGEASIGQDYHSPSQFSASSGSGGGIGSTLESAASTIFGGALGLIPLVAGLFGSGSSSPTPLQKYSMPSPISFEAADTGSGLSEADYGQTGMPRMYSEGSDSGSGAQGGNAAPSSGSNSAGGSGAGAPQVNVSVQAMDAQSFMDYSGEIAKAVRGAMLNLGSINDVVNEL